MIGTFPGKLALAEGEEVEVDLEIAGGKVRLTTGVSEIGSWPTELCAITPVGDGYRLTLEGEHVAFTPDHPEAFAAVVRGMDPASKSRSAPVPISDPEPEVGTGYDLEAALDQVLGGSEEDHHAAVLEDSPDDIAVTLEALFATAYPEFDDEEDEEVESPFAVESATSEEPTEAERIFEFEDGEDEIPAPGSGDGVVQAPVAFSDISNAVDETQEPALDEAPSPGADLEPKPVFAIRETDETVETDLHQDLDEADELVGIDEADVEDHSLAVLEAVEEQDDILEVPAAFHDESDAVDGSAWSTTRQLESASAEQDEDDSLDGVGAGNDPAMPGSGLGGRAGTGSFRPSAPAAYDDGDVYHDSPYGSEGSTTRYAPGPPSYQSPAEERRPAASFDYDEPSYGHGQRPAASFDLDGAVDGAGYSPPPLGGEEDRHAASGSGMFSRTASERFASVSGAIRSRLASDETDEDSALGHDSDEGMSIADQIVADSREADQDHEGKRLTPGLVKKLAIGTVVLFVVAGLVLLTPALIRMVIDRIDTPAAVETVATTLPTEEQPEVTATTTAEVVEPVTPAADTEAVPALLSDSVFSLNPEQFAERWDTVVDNATLEIGDGYLDGNGVGFSSYLGVEWTVNGKGRVSSYRVLLDPSGDQRDDALGIAALGLAINVSHPDYEGTDLLEVLGEMGLDVNNPTLDLNGTTVRDGVRYDLVYNDQGFVVLEVAPGSSGSTPTSTTTAP